MEAEAGYWLNYIVWWMRGYSISREDEYEWNLTHAENYGKVVVIMLSGSSCASHCCCCCCYFYSFVAMIHKRSRGRGLCATNSTNNSWTGKSLLRYDYVIFIQQTNIVLVQKMEAFSCPFNIGQISFVRSS